MKFDLARVDRVVQTSTLREFNGGWNISDNDLNLSSKYFALLDNGYRAPDGSVAVRYGTKLFGDVRSYVSGTIVNMGYYNGRLWCVTTKGEIAAIDGAGNVVVMWNTALAALLPGAPAPWHATEFASAAVFNGEMIICNGFDKPLIVEASSGLVRYLYDLGDNNNLHVPICRYVVTHQRYCVMAGDPADEDALYISNIDTSGTWYGNSTPNDGIVMQLGSYVPYGSNVIKGLRSFRDNLFVFFEQAIVVLKLGIYDDSTPPKHTPQFVDAIQQYGAVSHRTIHSIGDDVLFCDIGGVPSLTRALFTGGIRTERVSQLIDPAIQHGLTRLNVATLEDKVFSVFHRRANQYMLFVPDAANPVETVAFVFTYIKQLDVAAWSRYRGWNWTCAAESALGTLFFARGTQVFTYGDAQNKIHPDFVGDQETYDDETAHTDGTGFTPVADVEQSGVPVHWKWETPWFDFGDRMRLKASRHIAFDTVGTAEFTAQMFIDNIYHERRDPGEPFSDNEFFDDLTGFINEEHGLIPTLEMSFVGGENPGFGADPFGLDQFGGGRPTRDERLYAWTTKFKLGKLRFGGDTMEPLSIVSISLNYIKGTERR